MRLRLRRLAHEVRALAALARIEIGQWRHYGRDKIRMAVRRR